MSLLDNGLHASPVLHIQRLLHLLPRVGIAALLCHTLQVSYYKLLLSFCIMYALGNVMHTLVCFHGKMKCTLNF